MRRLIPRLAALLVLAAALLGAAAAAHATEPMPSFVEFTGTAVTESSIGDSGGSYPASARVDCSDGACVFSATVFGTGYDWDMTQGQRLTLENGHGEFPMSEWGDVCGGQFWSGAGVMTVDASAAGITILRQESGAPTGDCLGEVSGTITISGTTTVTGAVSGGNACVLDGSCPTAAVATGSGADEPGVLSTLPTVADSARPGNILWAIGFTVVLVLLIAFPAHLLNTAAEHGTDRLSTWWARRRASKRTLPPIIERLSGWPLAIAGVVVASVISAFVDPRFGQDAGGSLRIAGSILLGFVLDVAVGWLLILLFLRRTMPDAKARLRFAPASLLLVVAAVIFSRVTGFQPGIVFGLVAGIVIGTALATAQKARIALLGLGYTFVLGVVAWIAYTLVTAAAGPDPSVGALFVQETVSAVAVGGMAALPVALFPLRGMTGFEIFSWNRLVWAAAYAVGLVGFFFVLMPMPYAWQGVPLELGVWVGLYVLYAVVAVAIWAIITRPWKRTTAD